MKKNWILHNIIYKYYFRDCFREFLRLKLIEKNLCIVCKFCVHDYITFKHL